ncbi:hypothetical protein LCGC14_0141950 [marine sediment metagenome]|uniref:Capsule biosynthesis phosphatase n=1 Tax=marine sediment metagenome TaxID=412755 RepID=A0A0F9V151_9ZZZZ
MTQIDHAIHIKTIFCDLDGCVFKHQGDIGAIMSNSCELLPGVKEAFKQWGHKGYTLVITTGRPGSMRKTTEDQMRKAGLWWNHLIMDLPRGPRMVINDVKPERKGVDTALCVNLERNKGMEGDEFLKCRYLS